MEKRERGRIQGLPILKLIYPLLSQERVKSYDFQILYVNLWDRSEQKPIKNFRKSSRGRTQGLSKIFMAPIYRAHGVVIFAVAQLSSIASRWAKYIHPPVANLLQCRPMCAKNYENWLAVDEVIAKINRLTLLPNPVRIQQDSSVVGDWETASEFSLCFFTYLLRLCNMAVCEKVNIGCAAKF